MVVQTGFDPEDLLMRLDEFVLGRSGQWMPVGVMMSLRAELRRQEFVFGMASEVMCLLQNLPRQAAVWSVTDGVKNGKGVVEQDELTEAFLAAKREPT